jgi:hypothetical protein
MVQRRYVITYDYNNPGYYSSPCFLFEIQLNFLGLSVPHRKHITFPLKAQQINAIYSLWRWYINITITILDIIHRPVFI